jgi:nucleoside-diphosphate-sugar epimerase
MLCGKTALVTGGSGAVGSAVLHRLRRAGTRVRALVRGQDPGMAADVDQIRGNLSDLSAVTPAVAGADLVVHCAAAIGSDPEACHRTNVVGTSNLVAAMSAANCHRLIHVSTISVYDLADRTEFDEEAPVLSAPSQAYGYTKAQAEALVRAREGLIWTIVRPALVLSMHPRSRWGPLVFRTANQDDAPVFPAPIIPYVHVDNLVEAILLSLLNRAAHNRIYNVVDGEAPALDYFNVVYRGLGRPMPRLSEPMPFWHFSSERIRRELGYAPRDRWHEFLGELGRAGLPPT